MLEPEYLVRSTSLAWTSRDTPKRVPLLREPRIGTAAVVLGAGGAFTDYMLRFPRSPQPTAMFHSLTLLLTGHRYLVARLLRLADPSLRATYSLANPHCFLPQASMNRASFDSGGARTATTQSEDDLRFEPELGDCRRSPASSPVTGAVWVALPHHQGCPRILTHPETPPKYLVSNSGELAVH